MTCTAVEAVTSHNLLLDHERAALLTIAAATGRTPDEVLGHLLAQLGPFVVDAAACCSNLELTGAAFQSEMADYFAAVDVLEVTEAEDRLVRLVADFLLRASRVIETRRARALDVRPLAPSLG